MGKTLYEKVYDAHVVMQKPGELPLLTLTVTSFMKSRVLRLSLVCAQPAASSVVPT